MLRALPYLLLLLSAPALAAGGSRGGPVAEACRRSSQACNDGCAVDWGSSMSNRKRLAHCMKNCERQADVCVERAVKGTGIQAPKPTPYREERKRSRYAKPERRDTRERDEPAAVSGRGSPAGKKDLNVGAPDWLDDAPRRKPAAAPTAGAAKATSPEPEPKQASLVKPLPTVRPATKELPLEDAPLDELTAVELGVDDMELDSGPAAASPAEDGWTETAPASSARPTSAVQRAEAEELLPLDGPPASATVPAKGGSRELPSGFLDEEPADAPAKQIAPPKQAPSKQAAPAKPASKTPTFKKKKDISDWDPD